MSIGYLPQHPDFPAGISVQEAATSELPPHVPFWRVRKTLGGLGIRENQLSQQAGTLSGGEKTRLMLARLLCGDHDLLLLDEPTSHLDIQMLRWLEAFLMSRRQAFLVISHDRRFLDKTVQRIIELDNAAVTEYPGNYSAYAAEKQRRIEQEKARYIDQQRQINALKEFIARQKGWASETQSGPKRGRDQRGRIAMKMAKRAHAAERRLQQIVRIEKEIVKDQLSTSFQPERRSGQVVFEAINVTKAYGERSVIRDFHTYITYGERIGIVGLNGSGKTTLVKLLMGLEPPTSGIVRNGAGIIPLYLGQEQENLDPDKTVLESVEAMGQLTHSEVRTLLACFLFREEEVFKRVDQLSGGERIRLAVAGAVISGANLLVLDEPTNHLDIDTRERLEQAIDAFTGTLLLISHDRYLLDRLSRRLYVFREEGIEDFPGRYSEWEERQNAPAL
jgi:ATPase subunit of ABC transporter with duplicated ATPase domains